MTTHKTVTALEDFVRATLCGYDKIGLPSHEHSFRVAKVAATYGRSPEEAESLYIVGLAHDMLEDSDTTEKDLYKLGVGREEMAAIYALTNKYNGGGKIFSNYADYINAAILGGFYSTVVKFADVMDNLSRPKHDGFKFGDKLHALATLTCAMKTYF